MHSYYQQAHPFSSNITGVITPTVINPIGYDGRFNPSNEWTTPGSYTVHPLGPTEDRIYPPSGDITYRENAQPQGHRALFHNLTQDFLAQDDVIKARHEGGDFFISIRRTFRVNESDSEEGSYQRYYNQIYDDDAIAYINAVEAADGQALEDYVKIAIHDFIIGCKLDPSPNPGVSNWDAIKSSCFLAGPRTLSGILVPLKGAAPTNVNFVSGDYNRILGLKGNGINKRLASNRLNDDDPQDNRSLYVRVTEPSTVFANANVYIGTTITTGLMAILRDSTNVNNILYRPSASIITRTIQNSGVGGLGLSRNSSTNVDILNFSSFEGGVANTSATHNSLGISIFSATSDRFNDPRISFYSIGESVNLVSLDKRIDQYMFDINLALS